MHANKKMATFMSSYILWIGYFDIMTVVNNTHCSLFFEKENSKKTGKNSKC